MKKLFTKINQIIVDFTSTALTFLCLGVVVQLLLGEKLFGWDPVGNIQGAGASFIGVIALVVLYFLFVKQKAE
mgnify:CR=1 FL=1|jgi:hypothetical protein|tara:strand:+ start:208 stop:426 length:219 start_codon:yes stop_codon:yes gene_type:complete